MATQLTSRKKAAVLIASLGPETSARILKALTDEDIEMLTLEIATLGRIDADARDAVLQEFYQMLRAKEYITTGGMDYARNILENALGAEKAVEILTKLQGTLQDIPFEFIKKADPNQIINFIQDEHPQTIALILAHLDPDVSATIVGALAPPVQADVIMRIATMDRTPPEIVKEIEVILERKASTVVSQGFTFAGGIKDAAEVLNRVDRSTEKSILSHLEEKNPELVDEIKMLMFVFDDIVLVDDTGIQKTLREIDNKDLALALKASSEDVKQKIFKNMSERARQLIEEELEFMGPVRLRSVEEAQQKIVGVVRRLEEAGEIIIAGRGGGEDELVV
ncbi:MAG: flagellar motor switch protein FliG [Candidatus Hydrogenedentes bacterium]|nr:flagellar motor switch protein FliG [Candidatus Hydrogenedentota bacterium]